MSSSDTVPAVTETLRDETAFAGVGIGYSAVRAPRPAWLIRRRSPCRALVAAP
jgi:hypothetical protein